MISNLAGRRQPHAQVTVYYTGPVQQAPVSRVELRLQSVSDSAIMTDLLVLFYYINADPSCCSNYPVLVLLPNHLDPCFSSSFFSGSNVVLTFVRPQYLSVAVPEFVVGHVQEAVNKRRYITVQ